MSLSGSTPYFISLDLGTTSVKTALFDAEGNMTATFTEEYRLHTPAEDIVELDPEVYWRCSRNGIRAVLAQSGVPAERVVSVGACSQGETLITLDRSGAPLRNAIVWIDNRSKAEAEEIARALGQENPTGQVEVAPTWPITKILWMKRHEPQVFARASCYLLVEDYVLFRLTGAYRGEYSLYSSSYMLDVHGKRWWEGILGYVGVNREQLVELCEPGTEIGTVSPEVARELGLSPETRVVTGAMDQTAAMVGAGNLRAGVVSETTGAALVVCETLDRLPDRNPTSMAVQYHALPDKYFLIGWCASGGMTFKWLRDTIFTAEKEQAAREGSDAYDKLTAMAAGVPAGSQGLFFFPFMSGPGTLPVDPEVRGVAYGLELHHGREHLARAVMESLAFVVRQNVEEMERLGAGCTEVRSLGGGARSHLWNQIKADVMGRRVLTMRCPEAASLGTAVLQAAATGVYPDVETAAGRMVQQAAALDPIEKNRKSYERIYRRFIELERRHFGRG